jgi:hypothetical protein
LTSTKFGTRPEPPNWRLLLSDGLTQLPMLLLRLQKLQMLQARLSMLQHQKGPQVLTLQWSLLLLIMRGAATRLK